MDEFIRLQKISIEKEYMELSVTAQNSIITASAKIYVTKAMLEDLQEQISVFLTEPNLEGYWENDVPGIGGPPCVTLKLLSRGCGSHVLAEIYMELNDGGSFMDHHCRFYVSTDRDALKKFSDGLSFFEAAPIGDKLILNA